MSLQRARLALGAVGVLLVVVGAYAFLSQVPLFSWLGVVAWLAGGVALHDALIAPAAVLLGLVLLPHVPPAARGPLRAVLLALAVVVVLTVPLLATGGLRG